MVYFQEKGSQIKVLWCKDNRQVSLLSGIKKVVPEQYTQFKKLFK